MNPQVYSPNSIQHKIKDAPTGLGNHAQFVMTADHKIHYLEAGAKRCACGANFDGKRKKNQATMLRTLAASWPVRSNMAKEFFHALPPAKVQTSRCPNIADCAPLQQWRMI